MVCAAKLYGMEYSTPVVHRVMRKNSIGLTGKQPCDVNGRLTAWVAY